MISNNINLNDILENIDILSKKIASKETKLHQMNLQRTYGITFKCLIAVLMIFFHIMFNYMPGLLFLGVTYYIIDKIIYNSARYKTEKDKLQREITTLENQILEIKGKMEYLNTKFIRTVRYRHFNLYYSMYF